MKATTSVSLRPLEAGVALSLAALASLATADASPSETRWTGQAGEQQPFWERPENWSSGMPQSRWTDVVLGPFDTTLRHGSFSARSVRGDGILTLSGGSLDLQGAGSSLGGLRLQGGSLSGAGTLSLSTLEWSAGTLVNGTGEEAAAPSLTVQGTARLTGFLESTGGRLTLAKGSRTLARGAQLVFSGSGSRFHNEGFLDAHAQGARFLVAQGAEWINRGLLSVARGGLAGDNARLIQAGLVDIADGGSFSVVTHDDVSPGAAPSLTSTGQWNIGHGAVLSLSSRGAEPDGPQAGPMEFRQAGVHNRGSLMIEQGTSARFTDGAHLTGPGRVVVAHGARLHHAGSMHIGTLRIGDGGNPDDFREAAVDVGGDLTVDSLQWRNAHLRAHGTVTVRNRADLTGYTGAFDASGNYVRTKQVAAIYVFKGEAHWDGAASLTGPGAIVVDPGAVFHDHKETAPGAPGDPGIVRIDIALVENRGHYLKQGAGRSGIARLVNFGTVRLADTGGLFVDSVNNFGRFEVERSELHLSHLQQMNARSGTLEGGQYVIRDGTLLINNEWGTAPLLRNAAHIVLQGPDARLLGYGEERPLLATLVSNFRSLSVLDGATLEVAALSQRGALDVGAGSTLQMQGDFTQYDAETWLAGRLVARSFVFGSGSVFGAGLQGEVGVAQLAGERASFTSGVLLVDVANRTSFDVVEVSGGVELAGLLRLAFGDPGAAAGTYRILAAEDGVSGQFSSLEYNLDPAQYRVDVLYGARHVDVWVSAIPEVRATWLMAIGLAVLLLTRLPRRRPGCA